MLCKRQATRMQRTVCRLQRGRYRQWIRTGALRLDAKEREFVAAVVAHLDQHQEWMPAAEWQALKTRLWPNPGDGDRALSRLAWAVIPGGGNSSGYWPTVLGVLTCPTATQSKAALLAATNLGQGPPSDPELQAIIESYHGAYGNPPLIELQCSPPPGSPNEMREWVLGDMPPNVTGPLVEGSRGMRRSLWRYGRRRPEEQWAKRVRASVWWNSLAASGAIAVGLTVLTKAWPILAYTGGVFVASVLRQVWQRNSTRADYGQPGEPMRPVYFPPWQD